MITSYGWIDWAERDPGPAFKQYSQPNSGEFIYLHSLEAYLRGYNAVHDPNRQASWTGTLLADGRLLQHYPVTASVWATGNREANTRGCAFELEGVAGVTMTDAQLVAARRLATGIGSFRGRLYTRPPAPPRTPPAAIYPPTGWLVEHNEAALWATPNAGPTACPSHRWDRLWAMEEEDEMDEATVRRTVDEAISAQFLPLLRQALGVDESTFSDVEGVEAIRARIRAEAGRHSHRSTVTTITVGEVVT